ncbi:pyridoxal-phosphate dependent enzyme [Streptomyces halobius]|uniref:Pyridoxal-phosphate dependent enzyme n=1 Tax=Streptomyces halobius TaxID=2879846 RepID=A0ABY4M3Y6_9ACTN|nr:pyridoxal-phosphate dependent enzyme [Streptomyces halobius]UQA92480.1 pyridoxal-phosphate dependent enzyme [Streptomyces halobius]
MELYREDQSVVLRYAEHLSGIDSAALRRASLREGARILRLPSFHQVDIDVLDLSTLSTTGTFKDWVACVAVARALAAGHRTAAAQSSGNTANALAAYASRTGIRLVALYPPASRRRIHPRLARHPRVDFVEVQAPEKQIKEILHAATCAVGVPALPGAHDQFEGNKLRAYFLRDAARAIGHGWDWHVQAVSSAYGPLGFYRGVAEADPAVPRVAPRFLGVQQEAVTPYACALDGAIAAPEAAMLEPTLFRQSLSSDLIDEMRQVCTRTNGTVRCLPNRHYLKWEPHAIAMLSDVGIMVTHTPDGQPQERAGLYSLAGALEAISDGVIPAGNRVLPVYTGGSGPVTDPYIPEHVVTAQDATPLVERILADAA